jgi:DNA repair protein RadC
MAISKHQPCHSNFPASAYTRPLGFDAGPSRSLMREHDQRQIAVQRYLETNGAKYPKVGATTSRRGRSGFAEATPVAPHYHGHRNRLRRRLIDAGAEKLPDYELLEVLLFAANARRDVKPLAKALLKRFGGLAAVLSADCDALAAVGLSLAGIAAVKSVPATVLRLMRPALQQQPVINSSDKLIDYCNAQVVHNKIEEFHILFLDRKNVLLKHERQRQETTDHAPVFTREVVKRALDVGAVALIVVHNQPLGDPTASKADIVVAQDIKKVAAPLGVSLHDHIIIGRNFHISLRDLGLI